MSERCLAVNHGQPGVLLTLFAVRSRRHSYHSQADSAGSIPVTRSIREDSCSRTELVDFDSLGICVSGHARATLGHRYPHLDTHASVSEGRSACSVMFPSYPFSGSSNPPKSCISHKLRARCERAQLRRREGTRPVIPANRVPGDLVPPAHSSASHHNRSMAYSEHPEVWS